MGTRSDWEMWHCVGRICIHCCLSVSYPPLYFYEWLEVPLIEYLIPSWSKQCHFDQNYYQISSRISDFGHHLGLRNVMLWHKDMHPLLLECLPSSLIFERMIEGAPYRISVSSLVNTVWFLTKLLWNFKQNDQFWAPYRPGKCDAVSCGHTSIAAWVYPNLPHTYINDRRCLR